MREMTHGFRYHRLSGIGEGIRFTLQGLSGKPFQFLPTTCTDLGRRQPRLLASSMQDRRSKVR